MLALASFILAVSWTDKVTAISTAIAAGGFAAAAVGAWLARNQLKEMRRDRHIQVLSDFGRRWNETEIEEARRMQHKYSSDGLVDEVESWLKTRDAESDVPILLRVPNYFEDLAISVECGRLELEYVARALRGMALREWAYWKDAIIKLREDADQSYQEFEKLVRKLE